MAESRPQQPTTPDYYRDLGIDQDATAGQIKRAFHALALKYHPDKQGPGMATDTKKFLQIHEAFETLRDESRRAEYDVLYHKLSIDHHLAVAAWKRKEREEREKKRMAQKKRRRQKSEAAAAEKIWEQRQRGQRAAKQARDAQERADKDAILKEWARQEREQAEERSRKAAKRARAEQQENIKRRFRARRARNAVKRWRRVTEQARAERERAAEVWLARQQYGGLEAFMEQVNEEGDARYERLTEGLRASIAAMQFMLVGHILLELARSHARGW